LACQGFKLGCKQALAGLPGGLPAGFANKIRGTCLKIWSQTHGIEYPVCLASLGQSAGLCPLLASGEN